VYLRRADGNFADRPLSFFAGTSPAGLHLADFNGDGFLDLAVANQGSNDVSVLLGSRGVDANGDGTLNEQDLFRLGQRLRTDPDRSRSPGPNAVTSMDTNGDGIRELLVTNGQTGTVAVIPGNGSNRIGNGTFLDNRLTLRQVAPGPI